MKRLVPLLILTLICLTNVGGRALHLHHHLQQSASAHRGFQLSILTSADDSPANPDDVEQALAPSADLAFSPEPYLEDFPALYAALCISQSQEHRQGLGCGGLPA